jgi:hypothetical protein
MYCELYCRLYDKTLYRGTASPWSFRIRSYQKFQRKSFIILVSHGREVYLTGTELFQVTVGAADFPVRFVEFECNESATGQENSPTGRHLYVVHE